MSAAGAGYEGRVAVVTGAARGIGRIIAEHLLAGGGRVVGMSRGASEWQHDAYEHRTVDVRDEVGVIEAFRDIARRYGCLHYLINNAAVLTSHRALCLSGDSARAMIDTNFTGAFFVMREAAKLMHGGRFGRIISVSSMAVELEPVGDSIYAATKAALVTATNILARELAPAGITCNSLGVSAFETDMLAQLPVEKVKAALAHLPMARMATGDDILNVVDFFLADRSSNITAQTVYLGGIH
jgi:3-oxoacyl-[acyl-carrier protein] reductase